MTPPAPVPPPNEAIEHRPLGVVSVDGMPFVHCSCTDEMKPQSAVWLREHWQGDEDSGVAALQGVIDMQRRQSENRFYRTTETRQELIASGICVCSDPGFTHATDLHDWLADIVAAAKADATDVAGEEIAAAIERMMPSGYVSANFVEGYRAAQERAALIARQPVARSAPSTTEPGDER